MRARRLFAIACLGAGLAGAALGGAGCTPGPIEVATLPSGTLANEMVAYWPLDEGSGTLANDASGNGRNGFIAGPAWIPGEFKSALHFSSASYMSAANIPAAMPSFSVSAWALIEPNEISGPIANMVSTDIQGGGWALYATMSPGNENYVFHFFAPDAPYGYWQVQLPLVTGSWVHLAAVVDGVANTLTLYANGATDTISVPNTILPGSNTLYLGRSAALNPPFPLTGALDDVAIFSAALVQQEVAQLGQGPALPSQ
ncbi:MAG TPA: LamG domain-containing protein [Polyangia bacterium]|nr:LamG domain-containing protein [Polyangia bacterium]